MSYPQFISGKLSTVPPTGITGAINLPSSLFPHQSALSTWALRRGRAAVFADTGLGKMRIELAWADAVRRYTGKPVMMHTPLAVAWQLAEEAAKIGIEAKVCREPSDLTGGINITNYDRLHKFDASIFGGVVLDESGCIKHHDTSTFSALRDAYRDTPFKLPATATPAPNDWTELGTHAEFLGICTRQEMLSEFFTHDGGDTSVWRLKGHARGIFWRWVATWGAMIRKPSDLGFDDGAYNLPPLHVHEHIVDYEMPLNGMLFADAAQTLSERRAARRASMAERIDACVSKVFGDWGIDGMETRIRKDAQRESAERPGISSQEECSINEGHRGEKAIHEGLLRSESREVSEAHTGEAGDLQRAPKKKIRGKQGVAGFSQGNGESMARIEPSKAQGSEAEEIQHHTAAARANADPAGGRLLNMQDSTGGCEDVPSGRPLPCNRESSRAALLAMQYGIGEIQGQPKSAARGNRISLEPWVIWCELNVEQDALERAFGPLAFSIRGSDSIDDKESRIFGWLAGERPVIISKPSILGYGLNMQHSARMAFVGVTDSYEAYYQAVRREWRFGQTRDVHVHVFASKAEGSVVSNLRRKERDALAMAESLSAETRDAVMQSVTGTTRQTNTYNAAKRVAVPAWLRSAA